MTDPLIAPRSADPRPVPDGSVVVRPPRPAARDGRLEQLLVPPDVGGPRVRVGVLWFLLALASVTSGRWWTAALVSVVAAAAAYQVVRVWRSAMLETDGTEGADAVSVHPTAGRGSGLLAAACAAVVVLCGAYGTGTAGLALLGVAAFVGVVVLTVGTGSGTALAIGVVLPSIAALSLVLAVRADLWAGIFLVLSVSLFDAGNFLLGAEATGRWEGPVAGIIGSLAVTFTMSTLQVQPFDRVSWWVAGVLVAATAVLGQWLTSAMLPRPTVWVPAMRRLDAYVVAGPLFVACTWLLGG